jgi:predicted GNAT family N-acyltransferase
MNTLSFKAVSYAEAAAAIQAVRQAVFQVEQQIAPALDFDGLDTEALHLVAYLGAEAVGTARIRFLSDRLAKLERVAVLSDYRGQGIGAALVCAAIDALQQQHIAEIKLNAQRSSQGFYQKLGFEPQGSPFEEAGIPHIEMRRRLP